MPRLLEVLNRGAPWAYLWSPTPDDAAHNGKSLWYPTGGPIPEVPADWCNVYFGVHPCIVSGSDFQRAGRDGWRLGAANCLYADFDDKHYASGAARHVAGLPLAPTVTVSTGGGIHAYWIFTEPLVLTIVEQHRLAQWQRLWVTAVVRSDPSASDLSRVLRVPGSFNHKYTPQRRVTLDGGTGETFDLAQLEELVAPALAADAARRRKIDTRMTGASWDRMFRWAADNAPSVGRHKATLWLALKLADDGAPESIAERLCGEIIATVTDRRTNGELEGILRYAYHR